MAVEWHLFTGAMQPIGFLERNHVKEERSSHDS